MSILNLNTSPLKQPKGSTRFALNCVSDITHLGSDSNELGNDLCVTIDSDLVGPPILIDRDTFAICLKDNSVRIVNTKTCEISTHVQLECFGWDTLDFENYPVTGFCRTIAGCQNLLYLFDGVNRDKFINLSRPEKQKTNGEFDCTKFDLQSEVAHPTISRQILNSGGNLEYGVYNFAVEFLTSNEDSILISQVDINYTPITFNDEGALNISTNLADVGGRPKSSQSIKLTITNIPEDAILARIIVFRNITSDGATSDAHVIGELLPVNGNIEYTYRGFNTDNGDYLVDKNEYLKAKQVWQSSFGGLPVNNRLVRYNLKEAIRDYSNYQQYASKVCSKYIVSEVSKTSPNIHLLNRTLLGGEIILPTIVYVHKDGTVSNAYPLVNRIKNSFDEVLVDDVNNQGSQVPKWKLYDTSIKDNTPITGYVSSGEFGYYESDQTYANPPNFCQTDYWGEDCNGIPLLGTPVRLFVVPDRSVEPHEDGNNIRPIGIWFDPDSVEYPNDDVVGHYFGMTIVQQSNISSKGIGITDDLLEDDGINTYIQPSLSYPAPFNTKYYKFVSGEGTINNEYIDGDFVSNEGDWSYDKEEEDQLYQKIFRSGLPYDQIHIWERDVINTGYSTTPVELSKLDFSYKIQPTSVIENIQNRNLTNTIDHLQLNEEFTTDKHYRYLSIKNNLNPIPNVFNITSRRITNLNENVSFAGDNFIAPLNVDSIHSFAIEGFNGVDLAIRIIRFGPLAAFIGNEGKDLDAYVDYLYGFYTESKVNTYLRHVGTDPCSKHLQKRELTFDYFLDKMIEPSDQNYKLRSSFCPFFGGYNQDYSYVQRHNRYQNIGFTFDFCSDCVGQFPNTLIFSPQSFEDDLADGFRINRANDYVTIPSDTGAIIAVDYKDNKLVIRTERSCYFLQPNPQQMETSESNVYIGTGDFLSIPPQELNVTQEGYGGQQHKLDSINCNKGLIWSDRQRGEIYHLGGKFEQLEKPMIKWFKDNLKLNHLIMTHDPYYDRLIVTCKNNWTLSYCFVEQGWKSWHSYIPDYYCHDAETFYSFSNGYGMWKHNSNESNYTTFYGLKFPHIVELILNEGNTFDLQSLIYHSNVYSYANGYEEDVLGITYDQMIAYNDRQSTGLQNLVLDSEMNIYPVANQTHVKRTDRNFKVGQFKDFASSSNIWSTNISSIKQGVHGYMDKLPVVNFNINEVEMADFKSKWVGARLIFNQHDKKITLEFEQSNKQPSKR